MTDPQWEIIEQSLSGHTVQDKQELIDRLASSLREPLPEPERARRQREALARLCEKTDAMAVATPDDGLTNRDHDRILYTQ